MANINEELQKFKKAIRGEEVRDALISSVRKINEEVERYEGIRTTANIGDILKVITVDEGGKPTAWQYGKIDVDEEEVKEAVEEYLEQHPVSALDASTAEKDQVPTADGKGGWEWSDDEYIKKEDIIQNADVADDDKVPSSAVTNALKNDIANIGKPETVSGVSAVSGEAYCVKIGRLVLVTLEMQPPSVANNVVLVNNLPVPSRSFYVSLPTTNGNSYSAMIKNVSNKGVLSLYYPEYTTLSRIDTTLAYISES